MGCGSGLRVGETPLPIVNVTITRSWRGPGYVGPFSRA
jgi:hypothetical protein